MQAIRLLLIAADCQPPPPPSTTEIVERSPIGRRCSVASVRRQITLAPIQSGRSCHEPNCWRRASAPMTTTSGGLPRSQPASQPGSQSANLPICQSANLPASQPDRDSWHPITAPSANLAVESCLALPCLGVSVLLACLLLAWPPLPAKSCISLDVLPAGCARIYLCERVSAASSLVLLLLRTADLREIRPPAGCRSSYRSGACLARSQPRNPFLLRSQKKRPKDNSDDDGGRDINSIPLLFPSHLPLLRCPCNLVPPWSPSAICLE